MRIRTLAFTLSTLLLAAGAGAAEAGGGAEKHGNGKGPVDVTKLEHATATGVVTAIPGDSKRKSFKLKEAGGEENEYRAFYAAPNTEEILKKIAELHVGDRIRVEYTEHEGRRALSITAEK
jgi:hypothetical protein